MTRRLALLVATALAVVGLAVAPAAAAAPSYEAQSTHNSDDAAGAHAASATAAPSSAAVAAQDGNETADGNETDAGEAVNESAVACGRVSGGGAPADPDGDRLGWENGCWYNESIDVTRSDGLNDTEMAAVVGRSMARVEEVRGLEFERTPPVEVISREQFADETNASFRGITSDNALHQNVKFEALFMVDEETDAVSVQEANLASNVLGYYDPERDRIAIVSENETSPRMNEITLSQELFHALQWQRFDPDSWNWSTRERHNANDGIVEGDGNYVDYLYQQRCESEWDCLMPESQPGAAPSDVHVGLLAVELQPYSDGPAFVSEIHQAEGWEAVNAIYEDPPASTEQTIHPEKYGEDPPTNVSVRDRSTDEWSVLELPDGVDFAQFGEAGMYTMLWYPGYESQGESAVIPPNDFFAQGELDTYNYDHRYTAGWDGDRLYPYVREDTNETGETGYVWKSVWDSPDEAAEFAEGYERLLSVRGADAVDDRANTYRIPDDERFGDAYYVNQTGDTVVVVNAPTTADLAEVRQGAAPEATPTPSDEPTPTDDGTATPDEGTDDGGTDAPDDRSETPDETTAPGDGTPSPTATEGPGLGGLAAVAGLFVAALAAAAMRRL